MYRSTTAIPSTHTHTHTLNKVKIYSDKQAILANNHFPFLHRLVGGGGGGRCGNEYLFTVFRNSYPIFPQFEVGQLSEPLESFGQNPYAQGYISSMTTTTTVHRQLENTSKTLLNTNIAPIITGHDESIKHFSPHCLLDSDLLV